jgi:hypothetical protein
MDISAILTRNYPDTIWSLDGDDYEGLDWLDDSHKPTKEELEAAWPAVSLAIRTEIVERTRQAAYRETADPIFFEYQRGDKTEDEWLAAVQLVKDAHPYPTT